MQRCFVFSCVSTHVSCYSSVSSLELPHIRDDNEGGGGDDDDDGDDDGGASASPRPQGVVALGVRAS